MMLKMMLSNSNNKITVVNQNLENGVSDVENHCSTEYSNISSYVN